MEITHHCNSFVSVKSGKSIIACDPWVGPADQNAWVSYPLHNNGAKILNKLKPDYIYISHLHCDHFDQKLLTKFKKKNTKIIIKNFANKRLKKKIEDLGYTNILELKEWDKINLNNDFTVSIIPQLTSNNSNIPEQINYDLDTSILIKSKNSKEIFFNAVDNPLSIKDLKKINDYSENIFKKKIDILCLPVGAAGEYPQCFLNIDRNKEKKKIIKDSFLILNKQLKAINPKVFFPAGGSYFIFGKFSFLNNFIARPEFKEILKKVKDKNIKLFNLEGGGTLFKKKNKWVSIMNKKIKTPKEVLSLYQSKKYFYERKFSKLKIDAINSIFEISKIKYFKILKNFRIKTNWDIEFVVYENLIINNKKKIDINKSKLIKKYYLQNRKLKTNNYSKLYCHLDKKLFYGLLNRNYVWNQPLAGSLILFERKPNVFDPNVIFSLNFLGK